MKVLRKVFSSNQSTFATNVYQTKLTALKKRRIQNLAQNHSTKIVISGAGPAGLIRALSAASLGYDVTVLEKRGEGKGRENMVRLDLEAMDTLKATGIYHYMLSQNYIFPGSYDLKLCDLEAAFKFFLYELTDAPSIEYESEIVGLANPANGHTRILVKSASQTKEYTPNILVVTEGGKSTTNLLLGVERQPFLARLPVIAAIFKDQRPVNPQTAGQKIKRFYLNLSYSLSFTAHLVDFVFALIFNNILVKPRFATAHPKSKIAGAVLLTTPRQNYCGVALNAKETEKLICLQNRVKSLKDENKLKNAEKVERVFNNQLKRFSNHGYFSTYFFDRNHRRKWLPFHRAQWIEIGADLAKKSVGKKGKMIFLEAGDALATVDPVSGKGCSTAIATVYDFERFLEDRDMLSYRTSMDQRVRKIHAISKDLRELYRPDRVLA